MGQRVEEEVKTLLDGALQAAKDVVNANRNLHAELSAILEARERIDRDELAPLLARTQVPRSLREFVLRNQGGGVPGLPGNGEDPQGGRWF